jgi:Putative DNA-binding domain/ORF6C domain
MIDKPIKDISIIDINELFFTGKLSESQTVELKSELSPDKNGKSANHEFAKDITAFSNANGGFLIIGIDEKKTEIEGVNLKIGNQKIEDWITNVLNDTVDKTVKYDLKILPITEDDEKGIVIINVFEGESKPYYVIIDKKPIPYIRKGTSVFPAKPSDIKDMYLAKTKQKEIQNTTIKQKAKGQKIQQIGQNFGKIINTDKVQNVTEVIYEPTLHITDQQAKQIKDKVDEIVSINDKAGKFKTTESKSKFYAKTWSDLKNKFSVTKYTLLPKEKFDNCLDWLQSQIAYKHRPKLRSQNNEEWKKQMYSSIYAKAQNDFKMDKIELYKYTQNKLKLDKPITSLKDLSDVKLKKLYQHIFST